MEYTVSSEGLKSQTIPCQSPVPLRQATQCFSRSNAHRTVRTVLSAVQRALYFSAQWTMPSLLQRMALSYALPQLCASRAGTRGDPQRRRLQLSPSRPRPQRARTPLSQESPHPHPPSSRHWDSRDPPVLAPDPQRGCPTGCAWLARWMEALLGVGGEECAVCRLVRFVLVKGCCRMSCLLSPSRHFNPFPVSRLPSPFQSR